MADNNSSSAAVYRPRPLRVLFAPLFMGVLWTLLLAALFFWNLRQEREHVQTLALRQARVFFRQVVVTRSWNAAHGGVYVLSKKGSRPNEYLEDPQRDLITAGGVQLTKINPAYMTRQLSDIASSKDAVQFRITGLQPMRPSNTPDPWERQALAGFSVGEEERFDLLEAESGEAVFRYMAPLVTEEACLACHAKSEDAAAAPPPYLGGISVTFPAASLLQLGDDAARRNAQAFSLIWVVGLLGISGFTLRLNRRTQQAEAANRAKGMFLANISHDMRTPMQSILGMSELLRRERLGDAPATLARDLAHASRSLLEIINDVLDLSKIEAGKLELRPHPFSLRQAVGDCLALVSFQCAQKGLELRCDISPELPDCLIGDSFRLRQVISNLLGNAVKFTQQGFVSLEALPMAGEQGLVLFRVMDSGPGIAKETLPLLFSRFHQGESGGIQGTGLGLAICRELVELMHGRIWVENLHKGGACFSFTAELEISKVMPKEVGIPAQGRLRILLVEDNATNRMFMAETLEEAGHTVCCVEDCARARASLANQEFDLALVDLRLPDGFGDELARELRSRGSCGAVRCPRLLAMSASAMEEDRQRCLQSGMDGFLAKPLSGEELLQAVAEVVSRPESHEVLESPPGCENNSFWEQQNEDLDIKSALLRLGNKPELYARMAAAFLRDAPELLQQLHNERKQAGESQDALRQAVRLAHSLKNSAEMLGLNAVQVQAAAMENALRQADLELAESLAPELKRSLHEGLGRLESCAGGG